MVLKNLFFDFGQSIHENTNVKSTPSIAVPKPFTAIYAGNCIVQTVTISILLKLITLMSAKHAFSVKTQKTLYRS